MLTEESKRCIELLKKDADFQSDDEVIEHALSFMAFTLQFSQEDQNIMNLLVIKYLS